MYFENVKTFYKIILGDRKMKLVDIADTLKMSKEPTYEHFGYANAQCKIGATRTHNRDLHSLTN